MQHQPLGGQAGGAIVAVSHVPEMEALGGSLQKDMLVRPEAHQCCSGAQWVPIEVLEDGCGHRIGL